MKQLVITERFCLVGHILSKVFGLAGLLLVVPHPEMILNLAVGQTAMQWSLATGGVVDILLGTLAVSIYAYRCLGLRPLLGFMLPAMFVSLSSELLGTSTGFPFGDYSYLNGLGYKIAGLVPFTIPLSWFYVGFSAYLIARVALSKSQFGWRRELGAIALGAMLFTAWDFVLEPAMSQTSFPFWYWERPGAFFGTPYQNYAGWFGTSALFMSLAAVLWRNSPLKKLERTQLNLPLVVYLSNFGFGAAISLASGFSIPVFLGLIFGFVPALTLWWMAQPAAEPVAQVDAAARIPVALK